MSDPIGRDSDDSLELGESDGRLPTDREFSPVEWARNGRERLAGVVALLPVPSAETVVYALTAVLLFGGLVVTAAGVAWVVYQFLGVPATVVAVGICSTAIGLVLLVALIRAGYLGGSDSAGEPSGENL